MSRVWLLMVSVLLVAGCPSRELPPPPADEPAKKEEAPACGKIFRDPKVRGGAACCAGPAAGILKSSDIVALCGAPAASYLGETRDGAACRFHFQIAGGGDAKETFVMVSRPIVPPGAPAPVAPDPMLPWNWKKVPLTDAIGYHALAAGDDPGLLARQTILWAGRGRRIVGLHVSKPLCTDAQAHALLQRTIDGVP